MPYLGSGIMQRNTQTLRGLAQFEQEDQRNALLNRFTKQSIKSTELNIEEKERKAKMEQYWILGKVASSVVDPVSHEKARAFAKDIGGDKLASMIPKDYDPEFWKSAKLRLNITYDALGRKREEYLPKTEKEWADIERAAGIKYKYEKALRQMELASRKDEKPLKTWVNPDDPRDIIHLKPGVEPPKTKTGGEYVPHSAPLVKIDMEKKMPAEQVSKIGEFEAYQTTMAEIENIIKTKKFDTGPFEFIKKRIDNWGIMPDKERVQLRTLVARLPGLMYAMRGKQLSDKELEVAREMMPKMSSTETVFAIETKNFLDYMNMVLSGKEKAFKGAGYNVGGFEKSEKKDKRPPLSSYQIGY